MKTARVFNKTIRRWHKREHYEYQKKITSAILDGIARSKQGETIEIPIELPRQSGKTTAVVDVVEFILASATRYFHKPLAIGIFAPQKEQATTDFDRLKLQYNEIAPLGFRTRVSAEHDIQMPQKWNSKTIRLFDDKDKFLGEVYIFPIAKGSNPESKTLDIIIVEEAQDVDDERMKNAVFPMGASTNALRIYIGTAGTRICYFKRQLDNNPRRIKISLEDVLAERKMMYEKTGDDTHLLYERYIENEIQREGKDSDYIQRQYFLKWIIGSGQFCVAEDLDALLGKHPVTHEAKECACFVGIDTAKHPDRTVVTVIADNKRWEKTRLLGWLSLQGDNYEDQFDIIKKWLLYFGDIKRIAIDATGQADFMPDKFERHTAYNIERVKFSVETKDVLYKILLQVVNNKLTELPDAPFDMDYIRFRGEMLDLQKEYKGRFLSCHHPQGNDMHDDYADSWALAEYAKTEQMKKEPGLSFL